MTRATSLVVVLALAAGLALAQPMGGTYTIMPSGGDFTNFGTACAALSSRGYTRSCTLLAYTATYTAWGNAMNFSSDSVWVVFKAAPGQRPLQTYAGYGFNISGSDKLVFDSIWFQTGNHNLYGTNLKHLVVRNCSMVTNSSTPYAVSLSNGDSSRFESNITYTGYGLALAGGSDDNVIIGNRFHARGAYGAYNYGTSTNYSKRNAYINNFFYGYTTNGIRCYYDSLTRVYFNSFCATGSQPAIYGSNSHRIRGVNNILHAGSGYCVYDAGGTVIDTSDYNCLYTTGSYVAYSGGPLTWSQWQGYGYDPHGITRDPRYISPPDLHIEDTSACVGAGVSYAGVTYDIDGAPRGSPPCIGADDVFLPDHDVGCTMVLAPIGTIDSGQSVTPACSVFNYSGTRPSYSVRMRVGSFYNETATVADHEPGTSVYVEFPSYADWPRGSLAVTCSTEQAGDTCETNNMATDSVTVNVHDVAMLQILVPAGTLDSGVAVTPACSVYNYGTTTENYDVRMKVGASYNQTATVSGHAAGAAAYVTFPDWTPAARGTFAVSCSTELTGDIVPGNNRQGSLVGVVVRDIGAVAILSPAGTLSPGDPVQVRATVRNNGNTREACRVTFSINSEPAYDRTLDIAGGLPYADTVLRFPDWTTVMGSFATRCSTYMASDIVASNNVVLGSVDVVSSGIAGWSEQSPMPMAPSGKPVKDGGWLVLNEGDGLIYAAKGNKTTDFYSYDPDLDIWSGLTGMPYSTHPLWGSKAPKKGAMGCSDGDDIIYVVQGNNTLGFWAYSISANTWTILEDVPLGASGKKVKGGTDMVYVEQQHEPGYVYLLKGYKSEFYRYNTETGLWETLTDAPAGARAKWDKGSWLAYHGRPGHAEQRVWAHKAKYNELWHHDVLTGVWTQKSGMPFTGMMGRSKKSKDGGSVAYDNGCLYALKGGNTQEFWRYDTLLNTWAELETMPAFGSTGKKKRVKSGGDLVRHDDGVFFALKGNKTLELWRYGAAEVHNAPRPAPVRSGVTSAALDLLAQGVELAPNPLASGRLTLRYGLPGAGPAVVSVTDVTGRTVMTRTLAVERSGALSLDVRELSSGVYLVKLASGGFSESQKLVVER